MNWATIRAVFKRDFWSYFGDPTGYVFILVFVLLATGVNFLDDDFFVQNKANLDLLSAYSALNFGPGQTRAALAIIDLNDEAEFALYVATSPATTPVDVIVDVTGYFE